MQNARLEVNDPQAKMIAEAGFRSIVVSLHADHVASIWPTLLWMQAGAIALLLIGAVNLMNLLLIRASSRIKESAVRQALGASRRHVVCEAMVETTLLTLAGGVLGVIAAIGGIRLLAALGADRLPLGSQIVFDARSAGITLLGVLALGLALAAPITWFNLRGRRANAIQSEARSVTANRAAQELRHLSLSRRH
jgi:predicted lysophospholipase L1 biosynthesis ABC-type transport system permease subunit